MGPPVQPLGGFSGGGRSARRRALGLAPQVLVREERSDPRRLILASRVQQSRPADFDRSARPALGPWPLASLGLLSQLQEATAGLVVVRRTLEREAELGDRFVPAA